MTRIKPHKKTLVKALQKSIDERWQLIRGAETIDGMNEIEMDTAPCPLCVAMGNPGAISHVVMIVF